MTTHPTEQIITNRQDPAIETYRLGLLKSVRPFIDEQIKSGVAPPDYQIANLSPNERAAILAAQQGVGSYQQYLDSGNAAMQQGVNALAGSGAQYDPNSYQNYMNPYEDAAVQSAMGDIQRSSDIAQLGNNANAVGAGAFGGSRGAIVNSEQNRNTMDQQARTAAQMRAAGYGQAQQTAMSAFDSAMNRQQTMANTYGALGQGIGSFGQMDSNLGSADLQNLSQTGLTERGVQQAGLDATRMSNLQRYTQPYQQYGFLSDIYSGTPTGSSTLTASSMPQVSPFQTAAGLGIAGLTAATGAQNAGLF